MSRIFLIFFYTFARHEFFLAASVLNIFNRPIIFITRKKMSPTSIGGEFLIY